MYISVHDSALHRTALLYISVHDSAVHCMEPTAVRCNIINWTLMNNQYTSEVTEHCCTVCLTVVNASVKPKQPDSVSHRDKGGLLLE